MKAKMTLCVLLAFPVSVGLADPEVRFDFDGFPPEVRGPPGATRTFRAFATLFTDGNEVHAGWALSVTADGGKIIDVSIEGLTVETDMGEMPVD